MTGELVALRGAAVPVEVIDGGPAPRSNPFSRLWEAGYEREQTAWLQRWIEARAQWLANVFSQRSQSQATQRNYSLALDRFFDWLGVDPWLVSDGRRAAYRESLVDRGIGPDAYRLPWTVTGEDVAQYITWLTLGGLSPATVANYTAIASSFYEHCIRATFMVAGREFSLFPDAEGHTRANPFRSGNVRRPTVSPYDKAHPLTVAQIQALYQAIDAETVLGKRDMAILLALLYTGRRVGELHKMRWGDIKQGREPGTWVWHWRGGKGGKSGVQALPLPVYNAITAFLRAAGRLDGMEEADYIWQPLSDVGTANFRDGGLADLPANRPISRSRMRQIVSKLARHAGLPEDLVHPHTFRHTFAYFYHQTQGDITALQKILGHNSPSTTLIYVNSPAMEKPVDTYSQAFQAAFGF